jgi:methylenetetrahydrofolate dehydrogenase (NADP+)/methenyltetrahydrofolate cyclohydrolase
VGATIIDGKAVAARVREQVAAEVHELRERTGAVPGLATVLVGDDPASHIYVGGKQRASAEVGMIPIDRRLTADASAADIASELESLNADDEVSGILLQLPLPGEIDAPTLTALIDPSKDVDGLTPVNAGLLALGQPGLRPATPLGVMELLSDAGVDLAGANVVVVGRSNLFGKPMAALALQANATVTVCHSRTRDLPAVCSLADVLIAAAGRPRMVKRHFIKPGAVVIDVGQSRIAPEEAGNKSGIVGDVDFEQVREVASAITPVPGGVGPMTIALLLRNTLQAARAHARVEV